MDRCGRFDLSRDQEHGNHKKQRLAGARVHSEVRRSAQSSRRAPLRLFIAVSNGMAMLNFPGIFFGWMASNDCQCIEIRFPRVARIRYDKGAEGCLDTAQLAEIQASPRHPASTGYSGYRNNGKVGKQRKRSGNKGWGGDGRREVSGLFATGGGEAVPVKEKVFMTNGKPLEMCVIGNRFVKVRVAEARVSGRGRMQREIRTCRCFAVSRC